MAEQRPVISKGRILLVGTDAGVEGSIRALLEPEGYYLRTARGGESAVEVFMAEAFDLVLYDVTGDEHSGLETIAILLRFNPDLELLALCRREGKCAIEALKRGAAGYLFLPVDQEELLLRVNRILFRITQRSERVRLAAENVELQSVLVSYRKSLALIGVRDLDRLGDLFLDTLMELLRAEGAVLWLAAANGELLMRCRRGLAQPGEGERRILPDEAGRKLLLSGEPTLLRQGGAMAVPLRRGSEILGLARIELPSSRGFFERGDIVTAAAVADFASAAIDNALSLQRHEQDLLRSPRGEAYNMVFFRDHLDKELYKALRYGRQVSLIKLVIENIAELTSRFHDRQVDAALRQLTGMVTSVLRDADIIARDIPGHYYMLLPETDLWGALMAQKRIRKALRGTLTISDLKKNVPIQLSMRAAACPGDGGTFAELDDKVNRRLMGMRESLMVRGGFEEVSFWQVVDKIFGTPEDYLSNEPLQIGPRLTFFEGGVRGCYLRLPQPQADAILLAIARDANALHQTRSILYYGCDDFVPVLQLLGGNTLGNGNDTPIFIIGGHERTTSAKHNLVPIHIDDPNFARFGFLLYLGENRAYALLLRRDEAGWLAFHSADFYFVEQMIAKLQDEYQLQAQI